MIDKRLLEEAEVVTLTAEQVRNFFDGTELKALDFALDTAQGSVHSGEKEKVYIVVEVKK